MADGKLNRGNEIRFIGRFDLKDMKFEKLLTGDGPFSNIYQGKLLGVPAVFKVPKPRISAAEREQWVREAYITSSHPCQYVVQFLGHTTRKISNSAEEELIIAFELLHGDLFKLLKIELGGNKLIPLTTRIDMLIQAAKGLGYLHSKGILHRDLKLANIFFQKFGEDQYRVKIGDFGVAINLDHQKSFTKDHDIGNLETRAPEKIQFGEYTKSADIYSFGIVMWSVITMLDTEKERWGVDNWNTRDEFKAAVLKGGRPDIEKVDDIPDLRNLIQDCWSFDMKLHKDQKRPTWENVVMRLEKILLLSRTFIREKRMRDDLGNNCVSNFWLQNFFEYDTVEWEKFAPAFYKAFVTGETSNANLGNNNRFCHEYHEDLVQKTKKCDISINLDNTCVGMDEEEIGKTHGMTKNMNWESKCMYDCFYMVMMNITSGGPVKIEHWKKFCKWYEEAPQLGILNRLRQTLCEVSPFFHGVLTWNSFMLLRGRPAGSYLVRLNDNGIGGTAAATIGAAGAGFVLSYVDKKNNVKEVFIRKKDACFMIVFGKAVKLFPSLKALIEFLVSQEILTKPVPGPFAHLFDNGFYSNLAASCGVCDTRMNEF
eukprot:TRINITY_DN1803_c0_g1_i1.p1 TRINITY_DN1803_c0_g1~~TRINITY_DN1803_c0_g1_i1.p1  ORF type:complete len:597 (+),score=111.16 TRINITY_DN1803_c0_g1_i1:250-2040(+)